MKLSCLKILLTTYIFIVMILTSLSNGQESLPTLIPVINPGDTIAIDIYREEALSDEYIVDKMGYIDMNMVGQIKAQGLSLRSFQSKLVPLQAVFLFLFYLRQK